LPSKTEPGAVGGVAPALLAELAREPDGISLPRLCKRLGVRMSVLMRELAWLGEESIGGRPGAGLVRVERHGERDVAVLIAHSGDVESPQERGQPRASRESGIRARRSRTRG
jgi:hypothetical protein